MLCVALRRARPGSAPPSTSSTIQNRVWFALKQRNHQRPALQAAWDAYGAEGLSFEAVERLPLDDANYIRDVALKERLAHWRTRLNAELV